jgi:hypothetical protein
MSPTMLLRPNSIHDYKEMGHRKNLRCKSNEISEENRMKEIMRNERGLIYLLHPKILTKE